MKLITAVSEELAYYVFTNKKACLPGLGSFSVVYQAAMLNTGSNILSPPKESISYKFDKEEDSVFVDYLVEQSGDKSIYTKFKQEIYDLLESDSLALLPGIGELTLSHKGELGFNSIETTKEFDFEDVFLVPLPSKDLTDELAASNVPGKAMTQNSANSKQGLSFMRLTMLAIVSALCLAVYFHQDEIDSNPPKAVPTKLSGNINVSPKDIHREIYIASEDPNTISEVLKTKEQAEIVERQEMMSRQNTEATEDHVAEIVTNTFGSKANVEKQIQLIEALGFESGVIQKGNGLVSTTIILHYSDDAQLIELLEEIKQDFPRAKLNTGAL